jgi:hypothetical protein
MRLDEVVTSSEFITPELEWRKRKKTTKNLS